MRLEILSILLFISLVDCQSWITQYQQHFRYACPNGRTLKSLASVHDSRYEDRVWNFVCVAPPNGAVLSNCEWSGYLNDFDHLLEYQCPNENMICGIESVFDSRDKDRKWSYLCCSPEGYVSHACQYTPFMNSYDNVLNYRIPDGFVLRGINSIHHNDHEDRIFKFNICKLYRIGNVDDDSSESSDSSDSSESCNCTDSGN